MIIAIIIATAVLFTLICYCYFRVFYSSLSRRGDPYKLPGGEQYRRNREEMHRLIREFEAIPFEEVYITSYDGLRLFGRYYHQDDKAPLQILMHGYKGTAMRDFCGGSKLAREEGHNLLVIDQRSHGKSEGRTICFGIKERFDCLAWVEYASERFGKNTPIILSGVSMGAATVIMAAGMDLPGNVKAVIADCPYSSPYKIIRKVCSDMKLPAAPVMPLIKASARLFGGFGLDSFSPEQAAVNIKIPVLLIHGEDDRFVPCSMSRELAQLSPKIRLETFPDAGHGLSYLTDTARYKQLSHDFLNTVL